MLASDFDNPDFVGARNPDDMLSVEFYDHAALDTHATNETGIKTYRKECPFVRIAVPGNDKNIVERPAEGRDARRWPKQWLVYQMQTGKIANAENVPGWQIDEWPDLNPDQVRLLKHLRFYTVEQIAGANDAQVQGIGMGGNALRAQAQQALKERNSAGAREELAKREAEIMELRREQGEMRQTMQSLLATVQAQSDAPRKGR